MPSLSSLELLLEQIQQREDQPKDVPPTLPTRPVIRARLPRSRSRLPFNSQKNDCQENEDQHMSSSHGGSMFETENKRAKCGDSVESFYQLESADGIGGGTIIVESFSKSIEEFDSRNNENGAAEKIGNFDDANETVLQQILGIERHELNIGVITLQSFIRGENARNLFAKKINAIATIQKHVKGLLRCRVIEEEDQAAIYLQASIRGWLAWRKYNSIDKKEKQFTEDTRNVKNLEKKDQLKVPYSVLVDLQRRVLKTEALLDKKKEENASLRLQIKQLERKKQQYETKMKYMEKTWQDQLTSMQTHIAASKKTPSQNAVGKLGLLFALPENQDETADDQLIYHQKGMSDENAGIPFQDEPEQVASSTNQEEELQNLKLKFKTWKKDFKSRLMVAKNTIKKLGNSETGRRSSSSQKKWWGR